jgi:hypothetical protein
LVDFRKQCSAEMLDQPSDVPWSPTSFHIFDGGFQECSFATSRNLPRGVFSGFDGLFEPCEDGASDGSFVSAAALVNSDAKVGSPDRVVRAFAFAGFDEFEGHGRAL